MDGIQCLTFMAEKKEGFGEDSEPLFLEAGNKAAVAVFDGMGGSGATDVQSDFGMHSSAYVASRILQKKALEFLGACFEQHQKLDVDSFSNALKKRLSDEVTKYPRTSKSMLRSTIIREYPTTIAMVVVTTCEDCAYNVQSIWAGDSRNYILNPDEGLVQISKDDLMDNMLDPLDNLKKDSPLSNCICIDRPWKLNCEEFTYKAPFVAISATDGCFGYFPTPMHFEYAVLNSLMSANNMKSWEEKLVLTIKAVAADDISLSAFLCGFEKFEDVQASYKKCYERIGEFINNSSFASE